MKINLDSPSGHIFVCLLLLVYGSILSLYMAPHAEDIVIFALGVLSRSMIGANGGGQRDASSKD